MVGMKFTRRCILRVLLYSPMAALGLRHKSPAVAKNAPIITVPVCCAICDYYEPPQAFDFMLDGPPAGCCGHMNYRSGHYLCDEVIEKFRLRRKPGDRCGRFSIRKDLSPGNNARYASTHFPNGETQ
jgi:hypothetical protein